MSAPPSIRKYRIAVLTFVLAHSGTERRLADGASENYEFFVYYNTVSRTATPLLRRLFSLEYLKAFFFLLRADYDAVWPHGIDACLVASCASLFRRKKLIWDISDINPRLTGNGLGSRLLRFVESAFLKKVDHLILSSPGFYDFYYAGRYPRSKISIVENLLMPPVEPTTEPVYASAIRVVYSGIFRSRRLLELIRSVALKMPETVEFHLYGSPDYTVGDAYLSELCRGVPNLQYHGRFDSLSDINSRNHLIIGLVDTDAAANERWLLNNRLYHASAYRRPVIATAGSYSGQFALEKHLGVVCDLTEESLRSLLETLMAENFAAYKALLQQLPEPSTAYLSGDYRRALKTAIGSRSP